MSTVSIIFIGLSATVMLLAPLLAFFVREERFLRRQVSTIRQDIGEVHRMSELYQIAFDHSRDGIVIQDASARIVASNAAYQDLMGYDAHELIGRNPLEFALPEDAKPTASEIENFRYDLDEIRRNPLQLHRNQRRDGTVFWNQISISQNTFPDSRERIILVCRNVTEEVERMSHLEDIRGQLAREETHDSLTAIANRTAALAFIEDALLRKDPTTLGLLHIDIDNFKDINDRHGHAAGDTTLVRVAHALQEVIGPDDLVARVGGDEFMIICSNVQGPEDLKQSADLTLTAANTPVIWANTVLAPSASIGCAQGAAGISTAAELLLLSDFALSEAKRRGTGQNVIYDDALRRRHQRQLDRAAALQEAIDSDGLTYVFQPKLNLETNVITGFETLVRWIHPDEGMIPPIEFLPLVEELGLMGELDMLSMNAAIRKKRNLADMGFPDINLAFNASPELLNHPQFINRLIWMVEASNIDRSEISIEVLETTSFGEVATQSSNAALIKDLSEAGFRVELDDFGIGFAGLTHLAHLSLNGVKIDRGLVTGILRDETSFKIVRRVVELCNDLDLRVVAEGVEDEQTAHALQTMGCETLQGYWLSKPLMDEDVLPWLTNWYQSSKRA